jgi:hypothetical protein
MEPLGATSEVVMTMTMLGHPAGDQEVWAMLIV